MIETSIFLLLVPVLGTFFWFVVNVFLKLPLSIVSLTSTIFCSLLVSYFLIKPKFTKISLSLPGNRLDMFLLLLVVLFVSFNVYQTWYWPISSEFDALTMYDYRGKVFFVEKAITGINNLYHGSYPLYTSLAHTAMYFWGFQNPKLFYSFLLIVFSVLFYGWIKKHSNARTALLGVLILITTPPIFFNARIAYTNFTYMVYLGGSLLFLSDYLKSGDYKSLLYQSILMAGAAWTRPATLPFFAACLLLILLKSIKTKKYTFILIPLCTYLFISVPWQYFQSHILAISTFETKDAAGITQIANTILPDIPPVLVSVFNNFFDTKYVGATGFLLAILLAYQYIVQPKKLINSQIFTFIYALAIWGVLSLLIRSEFRDYTQWVGILYDSMRRMFIFVFPIIIGGSLLLPMSQKILQNSK